MKALTTIYNKIFAEITEVPASLQADHYPALDGLRGIAILLVLLPHMGFNRYLSYYHIHLVGNTGVHIFFVISGFLITTLLLKEKLNTGNISLTRFYLRRALRILPVAYLFLVTLLVLDRVYQLKIPSADFFAAMLFYKNLPMPNEPYTAHFWSLAVEVQFYLFFPFLLYLNTNRYLVIALIIILIVPLVAILNHLGLGLLHNFSAGQAISKLCMYIFWKGPLIILIGSVFAMLLFKGFGIPKQIRINYFLSFCLFTLAVVLSYKNVVFYIKYLSEYFAATLIAASVVITIGRQDFLRSILKNGLLRKIGVLSYSLYIWQQLFISARAWQPWLHNIANYPLWALIIIKLAALAIIAIASYKFELVFLKIKARYNNDIAV